jgi:threonyl-tRNA synthetase
LLENNEIRALVDNRNETIGKKIRDAEMQKIPFMLIVGEEEEKRHHFYPSPWTGRKRKHQLRLKSLLIIVDERDQKTLKHLQFNLNYKVIAEATEVINLA